jgi:hypothetical protein
MSDQIIIHKKPEKILDKLNNVLPILKSKFGIRRIGLFGSYAREEQNDNSDVDILIDFLPGYENYHNFMNLIDFLENACEKEIDLLSENGHHLFLSSI